MNSMEQVRSRQEQVRRDFILSTVEWYLTRAKARHQEEYVSEGLYGNAPQICLLIHQHDDAELGKFVRECVTRYVEKIAELDYTRP